MSDSISDMVEPQTNTDTPTTVAHSPDEGATNPENGGDTPAQGLDDKGATGESKVEGGDNMQEAEFKTESGSGSGDQQQPEQDDLSTWGEDDDPVFAATLAAEREQMQKNTEAYELYMKNLPPEYCVYCDEKLPKDVEREDPCKQCNQLYYMSVTEKIDWRCVNCGFTNKGNKSQCHVCELTKQTSRAREVDLLKTPMELPEIPDLPRQPEEEDAVIELKELLEIAVNRVNKKLRRYTDRFLDTTNNIANKRRNEDEMLKKHVESIRDYYEIERDDLMKRTRWPLFDKPTSTDVIHGSCQNSWLLCAMSFLAKDIEKLFFTDKRNEKGFYGVMLCDGGLWKGLVVSGLLPVGKDGQLVFAQGKKNQLWVPLLEKAAAMLIGSYGALEQNYNYNTCALKLLTGKPVEIIFTDEERLGAAEKEAFIKKLKSSFREVGTYIYTHTESYKTTGLDYSLGGLQEREAYLVTDLNEDTKSEPSLRVIRVNEPGSFNEAGKYWNNAKYAYFAPETLNSIFGKRFDDWMPLDEFQRYFKQVEIFRNRKNWYECKSQQKLPTSKDSVLRVTKLVLTKATSLDICVQDKRRMIKQKLNKEIIGYREPMRPGKDAETRTIYGLEMIMMILDEDEKIVASDVRRCCSHIYWSGHLPAGQYYIVCVSLTRWNFIEKDEILFTISIHSEEEVNSFQIGLHKDTLTKSLLNLVFETGVLEEHNQALEKGVNIYKLVPKQWPGMLVAVTNTSKSNCLVKTRSNESRNMVSHRSHGLITETSDVIPPDICQLVQIIYQEDPSKDFTRWMQVSSQMTTEEETHYPEVTKEIPYIHQPTPIMIFDPFAHF